MTEIPEHLLKRSRERRSALGLGGEAGSAEAAPAAASPATTASAAPATTASAVPAGRSAAPAPVAKPAAKPDSFVVQAYKRRRKIPVWAMLALSLLPLWAFMYARAVTTQVAEAAGPLGVGTEIYGSAGCAGCHGSDGGGGPRLPVRGRRGAARPFRTSRTSSVTCTTAPSSTTPPVSRSTATRPRGRAPHRRRSQRDAELR